MKLFRNKSVERNRARPSRFLTVWHGLVRFLRETQEKDGEGFVRDLGRSLWRSTSSVLVNFHKLKK